MRQIEATFLEALSAARLKKIGGAVEEMGETGKAKVHHASYDKEEAVKENWRESWLLTDGQRRT